MQVICNKQFISSFQRKKRQQRLGMNRKACKNELKHSNYSSYSSHRFDDLMKNFWKTHTNTPLFPNRFFSVVKNPKLFDREKN